MPVKTFYSTEDLEVLAAQGITRLVVDDNTVLTHLARDMAHKLGITLVYGTAGTETAARPAGATTVASLGAGPSRSPGPQLTAKPRGCQHGPLPTQPAGRARESTGSDGLAETSNPMRELVDLVRQLSRPDTP
jgi:hypothetical protein